MVVAAVRVKPDTWNPGEYHPGCARRLGLRRWPGNSRAWVELRFLEVQVGDGSPAAAGFAVGSQIAGYVLEEQIGEGGMASVFRAHDQRLDRAVALKILAPGLVTDEAYRQRFIRESRTAAAVDDPHIIPVFEAGEAAGVLFIAMRFVRGGDVRSLLRRDGPLPAGRVAEIASQVASALDAAHRRGLVHRDVKPANMLLDAGAEAGRPDHVYLSDFGLSKEPMAPGKLTATGQFLGTLAYMSPEQISGGPVDARTDQYALACAVFELLSGAPPFDDYSGMAVMYAHTSVPPPPLTSRRPDLPAGADQVFAKALAKAPADRYPTCREFAEAMRGAFGLRSSRSGPEVADAGTGRGAAAAEAAGGIAGPAATAARGVRAGADGFQAGVDTAGPMATVGEITRGSGGQPGGMAEARGRA